MLKTYKYDNYLIDSASAFQDQQFKKQTHKNSVSSNHQHEQYSTASSSDSDGENNQNQQGSQTNNSEPQNLIQKDRYKTELCRNFQIHGTCNYGKKCQYAHGRQELQQKPERKTNQYYKTRPCKEFFNTFACPYGQRCKYNHDIRKFNDIVKPNTFYQKKLLMMSAPEEQQQQKQNTNSSSSSGRLAFFQKNFNSNIVDNQSQIGANIQSTSPSTFTLEQKENDFFNKSFQQEINTSDIPLSAYMIFNESTPSLTLSNNQNFNQKIYQQPSLNSNLISSTYFFSW